MKLYNNNFVTKLSFSIDIKTKKKLKQNTNKTFEGLILKLYICLIILAVLMLIELKIEHKLQIFIM
jgi:hypothetical protein